MGVTCDVLRNIGCTRAQTSHETSPFYFFFEFALSRTSFLTQKTAFRRAWRSLRPNQVNPEPQTHCIVFASPLCVSWTTTVMVVCYVMVLLLRPTWLSRVETQEEATAPPSRPPPVMSRSCPSAWPKLNYKSLFLEQRMRIKWRQKGRNETLPNQQRRLASVT
jgi:hypothetical protein